MARGGAVAGGSRTGRAWAVVAGFAVVCGVLSLLSAVLLALEADWFRAVLALVSARASYWLVAGAWLRTPWGNLEPADPLPGPPPLTDERMRAYVLAGGLVAVALVMALALQALDGGWVG